MSTIIMSLVWPLQMAPSPKAVLISLADNANDEGVCWPSLTRIGSRTCLGRTAVIDAVKWLEDNGFLAIERTFGIRNRYTLKVQGIEAYPPVRQTDRSASTTSPAGALDPSATRTGPVRQADPNRKEPSVTAKKTRAKKEPEVLPDPPEWLDREAWDGFVEMRAKIKHPLSHRAAVLVLRTLATFRDSGVNTTQALNNSTVNNWRDVYLPKSALPTTTPSRPAYGQGESRQLAAMRRLQTMKGPPQ